jgi:hypothetical protein
LEHSSSVIFLFRQHVNADCNEVEFIVEEFEVAKRLKTEVGEDQSTVIEDMVVSEGKGGGRWGKEEGGSWWAGSG